MCEGLGGFRSHLVSKVSAYLSANKAKSLAEKQTHSTLFLKRNEVKLKKRYCKSDCPFNWRCPQLHPTSRQVFVIN